MGERQDPGYESGLLRQLGELAGDIGRALAPPGHDQLLRSLTSLAREVFDAAACSLAVLDPDAGELVFQAASGEGEEEIVGVRVPAGEGIAGWVVTSGQAIAVRDVARDPRFAREVAEGTGYLPGAILAAPVETDRDVVGVMEVLDPRQADGGDRNDLALLAGFARHAALAIEISAVFSDLGRVLLRSVAEAAGGGDIASTLDRAALHLRDGDAEVAALASHFAELGRLGEAERRAATRLVGEFLSYLRTRPALR